MPLFRPWRRSLRAVYNDSMSSSPPSLQELLHHPRLWRGLSPASLGDQRTGFAALDRSLPGRGWPRRALIELLAARPGIGELRLLQPVLRGEPQCWIRPPHLPYAPALARAGIPLESLLLIRPSDEDEALWATTRVLRSGVYPQVLAWHASRCMTALRRLQLAAETGGTRLFLFRPATAARQPSPAALRLFLEPAREGLYVRILKCRGGQPGALILSDDELVAVPASAPTAAGRPASRAA